LRATAMLGYLAVAASWAYNIGIPGNALLIAIWAWFASIAWNVGKPLSSHLTFWKDWWGPLAVLVAYNYTWGIADQLGNQVAVQTPITIDRWLGRGELPTTLLQDAFCGGVCSTVDVQWFDYPFSVIYMSHFFLGLTIAGILWIKNRDAWTRWMRRYLLLCGSALVVYAIYPMAPPWLAKDAGAIDDPIVRLTARGWESFGIPVNSLLSSPGVNAVAAMPSLHAALSFLIAVWGIRQLRGSFRWALLLYPAGMSTALVFYADHYVIDLLAGFVLVALVEVACGVWERSSGVPMLPSVDDSHVDLAPVAARPVPVARAGVSTPRNPWRRMLAPEGTPAQRIHSEG
jgi:hypothetical protein